jgi:hypothetical protein
VIVLGLAGLGFAFAPSKISQDMIQASVDRSPPELDVAWQLPVAASFGRDLAWQSNLSMCGPASVANTFRSLGEPATTEHDVLAGTGRCWSGFCILGLTLDHLADVARAHTKRKVTVLRDLSAAEFQDHLRHANEQGRRYIVNFNRKLIFGGGAGHFSPIGGYVEATDMVFVLDVNRNFQPWLISRSRLFAAMNTYDGDKKRGLLLIQ